MIKNSKTFFPNAKASVQVIIDHKYADAPWKNAKDSLVRATLKDTGCKL